MQRLPLLTIELFLEGGYRVVGEETAENSEFGALRKIRVSYPKSKDLDGFTVLNGSELFVWIEKSRLHSRAMEALHDYYRSIGVEVFEGDPDTNGRGDSMLLGGLGGAVIGGAVAGPAGALLGGFAGMSLGSSVGHHSRSDAAFISS